MCNIGGMILRGEDRSTWEKKPCHSDTLLSQIVRELARGNEKITRM